MRQYRGIALAMTGSDVAFTSDTSLFAYNAIVTATATVTLKGQNGTIMATIAANTPFYLAGATATGADDGRIRLSEYSANGASGTVYVSYSVQV